MNHMVLFYKIDLLLVTKQKIKTAFFLYKIEKYYLCITIARGKLKGMIF